MKGVQSTVGRPSPLLQDKVTWWTGDWSERGIQRKKKKLNYTKLTLPRKVTVYEGSSHGFTP